MFSFWPTLKEFPKKKEKITILKGVSPRQKTIPANTVEIVGRLEKVLATYFVVMTYSFQEKKPFYSVISGKYPNKKDIGQFIEVRGKFSLKTGTIRMEWAEPIKFAPKKT